MKKPVLNDFYDESDPRGCSASEYNDYLSAVADWEKLGIDSMFNNPKGFTSDDTLITGIEFTLKDGTKEYQKIDPPIVYNSAEKEIKTEK